MKKDIPFLPVEGISVVIAREKTELGEYVWNTYLLNNNNVTLTNVLISSKGYGVQEGVKQETSVLRHHISELGPGQHIIVEIIDPSVFHLSNEYWVSYFIDGQIYDKKFIFLPDSIIEENLSYIPQLELEGILHS